MNVNKSKSVPIELTQVMEAYRKVRKGGKATGIDKESWTAFDNNLDDNVYVIWNRMSSGSYHPQAVREVEIPKKDGKLRKLGIPTLRDRIAQQVVKEYMEKRIDTLFHENSYGYRPLRSAHQAIEQVKTNCKLYSWVIDLDISKFFDEIDHELMLKAVMHLFEEKWVKLYVERWLKMPVMTKDGSILEKHGRGTPQGGVISPLLANLYLHYTLDTWLNRQYPNVRFVRYADDVVIHCNTKDEAEQVLNAVTKRLAETKLRVNETKTRITYCKDYLRKEKETNISFEFLGFSFQPTSIHSKLSNIVFVGFAPIISQSNQKRIRDEIREVPIWRDTGASIEDIASALNAKLRGWIGYYGKVCRRKLREVLLIVDRKLVKWLKRKHKCGLREAVHKLTIVRMSHTNLFYHWTMCYY